MKFVEASPINFAGMSGNGNKEFFKGKQHVQIANNLRSSFRLKINDSLLPDPSLFSLLFTFN